jgi:endonuclease/exonuclease/phosphatase family metal-dependent hydrolase
MRLISWNTNGRYGPALARQSEAVGHRTPDVVALQEVRPESIDAWRSGLHDLELTHVLDSSELLLRPGPEGRDYKRRYFNLIASRWPLDALDDLELAYPERYLAAVVERPGGSLELHNAHLPPGSTRGLIKIEMFEALYSRLAVGSALPRVLCGDFNTPREERADGTVIFWGQRHPSHLERWQAGERSVILGLADHDLPDVFRQKNGYEASDASFVIKRGGKTFRRRYDHIFASGALRATACRYHHEWRDPHRLSDHSAMEVDFADALPSPIDKS